MLSRLNVSIVFLLGALLLSSCTTVQIGRQKYVEVDQRFKQVLLICQENSLLVRQQVEGRLAFHLKQAGVGAVQLSTVLSKNEWNEPEKMKQIFKTAGIDAILEIRYADTKKEVVERTVQVTQTSFDAYGNARTTTAPESRRDVLLTRSFVAQLTKPESPQKVWEAVTVGESYLPGRVDLFTDQSESAIEKMSKAVVEAMQKDGLIN